MHDESSLPRPLRHLGTFRRSQLTGRWFAGRHRDHAFGDDCTAS